MRIGPPRRLRIPVRSQAERRPLVGLMRRNARLAPGIQGRIDPLPPVPSEVRDGAERVDNWQPPCESPEARTVNRPSRSFSHPSTVVSGGARSSAPNDCGSSGLSVSAKGQDDCGLPLRSPPRSGFGGRDIAFEHRPPNSFGVRFEGNRGWLPDTSASQGLDGTREAEVSPRVGNWSTCGRKTGPLGPEPPPLCPPNPPGLPSPLARGPSTPYRHLHQTAHE